MVLNAHARLTPRIVEAVLTRFSHERSESFTGPMVQNPAKVFLTSPVRVWGSFDQFFKLLIRAICAWIEMDRCPWNSEQVV